MDLEEELERTKERLDKTRLELSKKEAVKYTYAELVEKIENAFDRGVKPACPTCNRGFKHDREAAELKEDLEDEIKQNPHRVKAIKSRLEKEEEKSEKLQELRPQYKQIQDLKEDLEKKKITFAALDSDLKKSAKELKVKESKLEELNEKVNLVESLRESVVFIVKLNQEITDLNEAIDELKRNNSELVDCDKTMEEFRQEEDKVMEAVSKARKAVDVKQNLEIETVRKVNALQTDLNKAEQERLRIEKQQREGADLEKKKRLLERVKDEKKVEQVEVQKSLDDLEDQIAEKEKEKNKVIFDKDKAIEAQRIKCNEAEVVKNEVNALMDRIRKYEEEGYDKKLKDFEAKVRNDKEKKRRRESEIADLEAKKSKALDALKEAEEMVRDMKENLQLRQVKREEREQDDEVRRYQIHVQCSPDLTNSVLTNHPGLTNLFLTSNIFLLHKNFGFNEYPGLMNSLLGSKRFVKSGDHCS